MDRKNRFVPKYINLIINLEHLVEYKLHANIKLA